MLFLLRKYEAHEQPKSVGLLAALLAISLAWNWRLAYDFALGASGFWFFIEDDVARFLMSASWKAHPYLITWDGIWQGGTFYLHGMAMKMVREPMVASKLVSAFYSLLPLIGIFVFTEGLYRNRRFSIAVVLFSAPLWLHILLSTGTLVEMPLTGFMLSGAGFLLMSTNHACSRPVLAQFLAALCFAGATSFHLTAWMMLVPVLVVWFGYAARQELRIAGSVQRFCLFALISGSYVAFWLIGCWHKFGSPLYMFREYSKHMVRDAGGVSPLAARILAYPGAIAYTLWAIFPLVLVGIFYGWFHADESRTRVRWTLITFMGCLGILIASAISSVPTPHAYRSTAALATMLIPISLAPLWPLVESSFTSWRNRRWSGAAFAMAFLLVVFSVLWAWDNHQRTLRQRRELDPMDGNAVAVGAWLRQEITRPQLLQLTPTDRIRVWAPGLPLFRDINIAYAAGDPSRIDVYDGNDPGYGSMRAGEYLVTPMNLSDPRLSLTEQFGEYKVYRFQP